MNKFKDKAFIISGQKTWEYPNIDVTTRKETYYLEFDNIRDMNRLLKLSANKVNLSKGVSRFCLDMYNEYYIRVDLYIYEKDIIIDERILDDISKKIIQNIPENDRQLGKVLRYEGQLKNSYITKERKRVLPPGSMHKVIKKEEVEEFFLMV